MIDERFFEVLRSQLSAEKEEKAALREQLEKLTEEMRILRESFKTEMAAIKQQNRNMSEQNRNMSLTLEAKDRQIADLVIQFKDAVESVKLGRKRKFAPTTEQRRLLNNRNTHGNRSVDGLYR